MKEMLAKEQVGKSSTYLKLPKNNQLFKLKAGIMFIDVMPFIAGKGNPNADQGMRHWERTFYVHKSVGVDNEMFLCLAKTLGEKCPICEFRGSLAKKAAGDEDSFELAKALEPKERQLFNVIDTKAPDKGIQVWDISKHLFGKDLIKEIRNSDEQDHWDEFWYLEQGFTLKIGIEERTFNGHSFPSVDTIHFKERAKDYPDTMLDEAPCLDDCLVIPDYDELQKRFMQSAEAPRRDRDGGGRGRDRGGDREAGRDSEERRSRERDPVPEREERSERRSRRDEPDTPPEREREEPRRRGREEDAPPAEERSERRSRREEPKEKEEDKGGDDPWAARDKGKGKDDAPPAREERSERRSRRDEPDPDPEDRPRVRSDEDQDARRERGSRRDAPDDPPARGEGEPKDWGSFERGRDRGGRDERPSRDRDDAPPAREERSERRSRR